MLVKSSIWSNKKTNIANKVKSEIKKCKLDPVYFCESFLGYEVNWYNKPFLKCTEKQIVYRAGRQSGKSKTSAAKLLYMALFAYEYDLPSDEIEAVITIASLKLDQAKLIIREMNNLILKSPKLKLFIKNSTRTYIEIWWANGKGYTTIECLALGDPSQKGSGTRGVSPICILVDEAAHLDANSLHALYGGGVARNSTIILCSTPNGSQGRFFETCRNAKMAEGAKPIDDKHSKDKNAHWTQINAISSWNKHADKEYLKRRKSEMSEALFKQEYLGMFIGTANYLFKRGTLSLALSNIVPHSTEEKYSLGVDVAGTGADSNVFTVGRIDNNKYSLNETFSETNMNVLEIADKVQEIKGVYGNSLSNIVIERNGVGQGSVDVCKERGVDITGIYMTPKLKSDLYLKLSTQFEKKNIYLNNINYEDRLFNELQDVKKKFNTRNQIQIIHGDGNTHNDFVSSFLLSVYPILTGGDYSVIDNMYTDSLQRPHMTTFPR